MMRKIIELVHFCNCSVPWKLSRASAKCGL